MKPPCFPQLLNLCLLPPPARPPAPHAGVFSVLVYLVGVDSAPSPEALGPAVWQALAARRPLLLLVNKGIKLTEALRVRVG